MTRIMIILRLVGHEGVELRNLIYYLPPGRARSPGGVPVRLSLSHSIYIRVSLCEVTSHWPGSCSARLLREVLQAEQLTFGDQSSANRGVLRTT